MRKARKILMIIGFVLSIVAVVVYAICAGVFFACASSSENIEKFMEQFNWGGSPDDAKFGIIGVGIAFCIIGLFDLLNACLAFKGRKNNRFGLMILNIIFGVLSGTYVNSVGAIFGIIEGKKERE